MTKAESAAAFHQNRNLCSASVLKAFREETGLSEEAAAQVARPMAGGRMGTCGAVLAAEYVLEQVFSEQADQKKAEFEARFIARNQSVICRELKGMGTGIILRSCRGCVTDAAALLEEFLLER